MTELMRKADTDEVFNTMAALLDRSTKMNRVTTLWNEQVSADVAAMQMMMVAEAIQTRSTYAII